MGKRPWIAVLSCLLALTGCGGSTVGGTGVTKTPTPAAPSTAGYVPLTETAFIGDSIVLNWSAMSTGGASFGVFGISTGTTEQITQQYDPEICASCTPSQYTGFQYLVSTGMKRAVLILGTHDVLDSQPCEGGPAAAWDGKAGDAGDPTAFYYPSFISAAQDLFPQVSLVVGTIPPLGAPYNSAGCATVVNTLNGEIKTMAAASKVPVADFNSALSTADISTTGAYEGIVPTASGYTIMSQVYGDVNQ